VPPPRPTAVVFATVLCLLARPLSSSSRSSSSLSVHCRPCRAGIVPGTRSRPPRPTHCRRHPRQRHPSSSCSSRTPCLGFSRPRSDISLSAALHPGPQRSLIVRECGRVNCAQPLILFGFVCRARSDPGLSVASSAARAPPMVSLWPHRPGLQASQPRSAPGHHGQSRGEGRSASTSSSTLG
jgi:hypothetical protein